MTRAQLDVDIPMLAFPEWSLTQLFHDTSLCDLKGELPVQAASPTDITLNPFGLPRRIDMFL